MSGGTGRGLCGSSGTGEHVQGGSETDIQAHRTQAFPALEGGKVGPPLITGGQTGVGAELSSPSLPPPQLRETLIEAKDGCGGHPNASLWTSLVMTND